MTSEEIPSIGEREFARRIAPGQRFPLSGQWELTCRCNLACLMCYTDPFNTPGHIGQELEYDEVIRILDELHDAGCLELCFTGGEPLARADFLRIYTYAKQKGFLVTVFTNGTLITPEIADQWVRYPPSMIEISFHGLTETSFDSITRGRGSHARCLAGVRLLLERRLPVTLKTTGMTVNRDEVLAIKEHVQRLGNVQYKFGADIRSRLDGAEDVYDYQLTAEELAAIEQQDPEFRGERARQDCEKQEMIRSDQDLCRGGRYKFHIDAYGQLQLCSANRRQSYDLRQGSFREGFYECLPRCPCPNRPLIPSAELLPVETVASGLCD